MESLLPFLSLALAHQGLELERAPRLRTILPNGATVLVERVPNAPRIAARLFMAARGAEETPATNGMRHLLEHLVATGRDGRLDERLEREGAFLNPQTLRDAVEFDVDAPNGKLDLALGALGEMLRLRSLTMEAITREVGVIRQEGALQSPAARLSAAAWRVAYGDAGLAPFGDLDAMRRATPASLAELHGRLTAGPNLVIVVAGDVDLDKTTAAAASVVRTAPRVDASFNKRPPGKGGANDDADAYGEARALPVPSYDDPRTIAALAAALAVASDVEGAFVTYTPTDRPGLVLLGQTQENTGLGSRIDRADAATLWARGRLLVDLWLRRQTADLEANASLRGLLLAQDKADTPDNMRDAIAGMRYEAFAAALAALKGPNAVRVTGQ